MSLGGNGANSALQTAITNSVNAGITYVVAAGNSAANFVSTNFVPAAYTNVRLMADRGTHAEASAQRKDGRAGIIRFQATAKGWKISEL